MPGTPGFPGMLAFFGGSIGWMEVIVLLGLGLLIFGKRLPEVGKSLGKGIVEFKKGLSGIEDDIEESVPSSEADHRTPPNRPSPPLTQQNGSTESMDTESAASAPSSPPPPEKNTH